METFSLIDEFVMNQSDIEKFYSGKTVLVTGVTGFVGKALVEKLLRSCTSIKTIIVLIRKKRNGKSESELYNCFSVILMFFFNRQKILRSDSKKSSIML
jgi:FlaA1/EpsC-like NDP-sugar epimerase